MRSTARPPLPDVNERTAKRYMRVAQFASPFEEEMYEARTGVPLRGRIPVDFAKLKVPVSSGAATKNVAFADASVDQVRAASKLVGAHGAGSRAKESPIVVALRKRLRGELAHVTVRVSGGTVSLGNIGLQHVAALAKALGGFKPPPAYSGAARLRATTLPFGRQRCRPAPERHTVRPVTPEIGVRYVENM